MDADGPVRAAGDAMIWLLLVPFVALLAFLGLAIAAQAAAYRREYEEYERQDPVRARRFNPQIESARFRAPGRTAPPPAPRSEEHTSELQSLMRISYAVFCLKKKTTKQNLTNP